MSDSKIYCDNLSTTFVHPEVINAMNSFMEGNPGNPSSNHDLGRIASEKVEASRGYIANFIGANKNEIIFTSSATESNNLAILGTIDKLKNITDKKTILISSIEHPAVTNPVIILGEKGYNVVTINCNQDGLIDINDLEYKLNDDVILVSIMLVNNELGTIQPLEKITKLIRNSGGAIIHTDAAQAIGKIPLDVNSLDVDLMSFSSHKMCGPKGIGGLFIKNGPLNFPINPILLGGEQEHGIRSSTLNVPGIIGFAESCKIAKQSLDSDADRISKMRDKIEFELKEQIPDITISGENSPRIPGGSNFTIKGINGDALVSHLNDVEMSTGSACKSGAPTPSHVLIAIGKTRDEADCTARFCLSSDNSDDEIPIIVSDIVQAYQKIKSLNE